MPNPTEEALLQLALKRRLLTGRQADFVRKELARGGPATAGELMLRRHYVTKEQFEELQAAVASSGSVVQRDPPTAPDPAPAAPQAPAGASPEARKVPEDADDTKPGAPARDEAQEPASEDAPKKRSLALPPSKGARPGRVAPSAHPSAQPRRLSSKPAHRPVQPPPEVRGPVEELDLTPLPPEQTDTATPPEVAEGEFRQPKTLVGLLKLARHWGCSDLHLTVGRPPFVRLHGKIRYMERDPLTPEKCKRLVYSALSPEQQEIARRKLQLDFSLDIPNSGRYRCNIFRQRLGWDGAFRIVSDHVPSLQELGLPDSLRVLTEYNQGLVLISGSGGAGKTTTVAAMLDLVNRHRSDHIITVEDPVEYVLRPRKCQITQREVGLHTESFANALRAALREDPDIIMVGEMRDLETTSIAISAAETGHLVFGTLHTSTASRTVSRIVDIYPTSQRVQVLTMVAESLRGVICQQLVPRKDGHGRVLAREVLINTSGIAAQIKEGKTHLITSLIQGGKKLGMILMDESLMELCRQDIISGREAYHRAVNKEPFEPLKDQD